MKRNEIDRPDDGERQHVTFDLKITLPPAAWAMILTGVTVLIIVLINR